MNVLRIEAKSHHDVIRQVANLPETDMVEMIVWDGQQTEIEGRNSISDLLVGSHMNLGYVQKPNKKARTKKILKKYKDFETNLDYLKYRYEQLKAYYRKICYKRINRKKNLFLQMEINNERE